MIEEELPRTLRTEDATMPENAREELLRDVINDLFGFGPIQPLLDDPTVTEVMVNRADRVYVERNGKPARTTVTFDDDAHLQRVIDRILQPLGKHLDGDNPLVDARLPDGSRVNVVIPPVAIAGACVTIRKFSRKRLVMEDLVNFGSLTQSVADFLKACVQARLNIVVCGGTGSGKTTLLNVLSSCISEHERIVTIEDAAELKLNQDHVITLEAKRAGADTGAEVTIRELVRNALRMRPERIVVGECRGAEALDMLQAMNTGHDGSLTTLHANSPRDAISRIETMALMAGIDFPVRVIREQIGSAVHLLVHQAHARWVAKGDARDGDRRHGRRPGADAGTVPIQGNPDGGGGGGEGQPDADGPAAAVHEQVRGRRAGGEAGNLRARCRGESGQVPPCGGVTLHRRGRIPPHPASKGSRAERIDARVGICFSLAYPASATRARSASISARR